MNPHLSLVSAYFLACLALPAVAAAPAPETTLTIYQNGSAVVSQTRTVDLAAGRQSVQFNQMPQSLDLQSLWLSGSGVRLLGTSYQPPASRARMLQELVGTKVTLRRGDGNGGDVTQAAQLLAADGALVVRIDGKIEWLDDRSPWRPALSELPSDATLAGALTLVLDAAQAGKQPLTMTYQTGGLGWGASYVARLDQEQQKLVLRASATITNGSGVDWNDAQVSLLAGQVNRAQSSPRPMRGMARVAAFEAKSAAPAFAYYRYALEQPITLAVGEHRSVTLFREAAIAVEIEYRIEGGWGHYGGEQRSHASIHLQFENQTGKPLPAGTASVYGQGKTPLLLGEDRISNTPDGGSVDLVLGRAFDITAERTTTQIDKQGDTREVTRQVVVHNAKQRAVTVRVIGSLPGDWQMLDESSEHELLDARRVAWSVPVPAGGKSVLSYRFRYR